MIALWRALCHRGGIVATKATAPTGLPRTGAAYAIIAGAEGGNRTHNPEGTRV